MNTERRLELTAIRKLFPEAGVEALKGVDFQARGGEIRALIGENGAGKSTLLRIAAGLLEASSGQLSVNGQIRRFHSTAEAFAAGIGLVAQHPVAFDGFKLWQDCVLGAEQSRWGFLDDRRILSKLAALNDTWGFGLDLKADSAGLSVSHRQKAAMLSLLYRQVEFFLLDEPTAVLTPFETARLFDLLAKLRDDGYCIVLVSHKIDEILAIADQITILQRGSVNYSGPAAKLDRADIMRRLFPSTAKSSVKSTPPPQRPAVTLDYRADSGSQAGSSPASARNSALKVSGLVVEVPGLPFLRGLDFQIPQGQIFGVAGVRESGLETLERALPGLIPLKAGQISLAGQRVDNLGINWFRQAGGAYIPADRMKAALAPSLSLADNLIVHVQGHKPSRLRGSLGQLQSKARQLWTEGLMAEAGVSGDPRRPAGSFSGGSLQRLIIARELAENPSFMLLVEPGWGLDAKARSALEQRLVGLAAAGKSILILSSDLDELITLASEILVLRDGRLTGRLKVKLKTETDRLKLRQTIAAFMTGLDNDQSA